MDHEIDLVTFVDEKFPDAEVFIDGGQGSTGTTWIDFKNKGREITVEIKPEKGFGLYTQREKSFGSGPDETYGFDRFDELLKRVEVLLL